MSLRSRMVLSDELESVVPTLASLLRATVNGGTALGFLPHLSEEAARDYWRSLRRELAAGSRRLVLACTEHGIVGSGQLRFHTTPNGTHRAEVEKLFVAPALKGLGIGRFLMAALHDSAREAGRTLLYLNTRRDNPAAEFYRGLGYQEVGVVPGWSVGASGEPHDHVFYYKEVLS